MTRHHVGLQVDEATRRRLAQRGPGQRLRDERHLEAIPRPAEATVSETPSMATEPFSATRGASAGGSEMVRRAPCPSGFARQHLADGVDVAGHQVTAEPVGEPQRPLQVDAPWRRLWPARVFRASVEAAARGRGRRGFEEVEAAHRAIVREIERAREVAVFGLETARTEGAEGRELAGEAVSNAIALLTYQLKTAAGARSAAEPGLARAQAEAFFETRIALERSRVGLWAHLGRQSGRRAARQFRRLAGQALRTGARETSAGIGVLLDWILRKVGWVTPPAPPRESIERRAQLGQILNLHLGERDLPLIYRRLFRLTPVEDTRFLVGREAEMAGLAEALSSWKAGAAVSVIVVGARGSGKTSLLNCASSEIFAGLKLVRGQISRRLTSPAELRAELSRLLEVPGNEDLDQALAAERRVIVVEEFERIFLRRFGGLEALREFVSVISTAGRNALWIVTVNETSFAYLEAVAGLGRHFSHRINAMSVPPEALSAAILQRHNLSGLRLEFAPPPEGDPRVRKVRRFLGLEKSPRDLFFEALYRQSEGVFRSAFELWQDSIERVEGGVVYMRQRLDPSYRRLEAELNLDDCFLLQAILQHGSLTAAECRELFDPTAEDFERRLQRLEVLEILEPEPMYPGLRVRPQAHRFVRDALQNRNLL